MTSLELVIGMAAAAAAARGLSSLLYRVSPYDATTFAAAVAVVGGGAMLMTYLAEWRARTIDPIVVLKQE
jgi:putative ABC transport system permease protein